MAKKKASKKSEKPKKLTVSDLKKLRGGVDTTSDPSYPSIWGQTGGSTRKY